MSAGDPIDKDSKINRFQNRVINEAQIRIERDRDFIINNLKGDHPLLYRADFNIKPNDFNQVSVTGGKITVSAMVDLFQYYAYCLTSIRKTKLNMISAYNTDSTATTINIYDGFISALDPSYRMPLNTFKNYVAGIGSYGTNVLTPFSSGNIATEADVDNLIERLRSIVLDHINSTTVTALCCHSSCHASCHSSRGRR